MFVLSIVTVANAISSLKCEPASALIFRSEYCAVPSFGMCVLVPVRQF